MPLQAENMGDLLASTLRDLGEMRWTDITSDIQQFYAMRELTTKNRVALDSGTAIQWDIQVAPSGSFSFVGLYGTDNVNVSDSLIQGNAPWRHATTNYAIDRREVEMNRSPRKIVDLLQTRRIGAMVSQAEGMETAFWSFPASTDSLTPYGVAYWIVKNATKGFTGSAQSGYTTVGGVNPSTYPRWKNWAAPYTAVTKDDLIVQLREASTKTGFKPPVDGIPTFNTGDKYGYYTNYAVVGPLEQALEAQNDNLGNDVASKDGSVLFRKVAVDWVPKLDADTTNPVYGINWGVFKTYILRGEWLREVKIEVVPGQHTVSAVHIDSSLNWVCKDRRRNFVVSNGTTYPS